VKGDPGVIPSGNATVQVPFFLFFSFIELKRQWNQNFANRKILRKFATLASLSGHIDQNIADNVAAVLQGLTTIAHGLIIALDGIIINFSSSSCP